MHLFYNLALKPQIKFMFVIEVASIEEAGKLLFRNVKILIIDFIYVLQIITISVMYPLYLLLK